MRAILVNQEGFTKEMQVDRTEPRIFIAKKPAYAFSSYRFQPNNSEINVTTFLLAYESRYGEFLVYEEA